MILLPKLRFNRTSAVDSDVVGRGLFHGPVTQGDPVTLLVLLVMVAPLGCGMKGPPRAPLIVVPGPVTALEIRRFGGEVQVGFTLPTRNQDNTEPADLVRVDVYAMTTQPRVQPDRRLDLEEFQGAATLVTSIEVRPRETSVAADLTGEVPVDPRPGQGFPVDITEMLAAAILVPVDPWEDEREDEDEDEGDEEDDDLTPESPVRFPLMTPLLPGPLQREYVVVSVSGRGHESAAQRVVVPMTEPPAPPPAATVTYTETTIEIAWELPPGARAAVQPAPPLIVGVVTATAGGQTAPVTPTPPGTPTVTLPLPMLRSRPIVEWPRASRYDIYQLDEIPDEPAQPPSRLQLNMVPLIIPEYTDRRVEFGVERCYAVSTLDVVGGLDVRSRLSDETCVTFVDTFPPAVPTGLLAVGSDGAVGLIWQPNDEADLAGYLVLRGLPPGETLQPLTPAPVPENSYTDVTAEPGVRYVYAVRAVDSTTPANVSPLSTQAEAAAR